ncbi:hypothetical protein [Clostridium sp. JS66]|uniref:hypothetical protein n=1 Tax=Clostridium sp. JS66 TaxID=3064705 RepID=UPI00298DDBB2|nr:hypothetical protein [Clostridium sp. JS66]WPC41015.1 hypothetical protein Q6H37_24465 [Clostridium sp. JS66]
MNIVSNQTKPLNYSVLANNKLNKKNPKNSLSANDKVMEALEKQKETLMDRIKKLEADGTDDKTKQSTINDLNKQLNDLNTEISKIKMEKLTHKKEKDKEQKKDANPSETKNDDKYNETSEQTNKLINIFSNISELSKMRNIKSNMSQQINVILSEPDPKTGTYSKSQINTMNKLSINIDGLDEKISSKMKEISNGSKATTQNKITKSSNETDNTSENSKSIVSKEKADKKDSKNSKVDAYV